MERKPQKTPRAKMSSDAAKITSQLIAEQTNAFLKAGGKIVKIRSGVRDQEINAQKTKVKEKA